MNRVKRISKFVLCLILIVTEIALQIPTVVNACTSPYTHKYSQTFGYTYNPRAYLEPVTLGKPGKPAVWYSGNDNGVFTEYGNKVSSDRAKNRIMWQGVSASLMNINESWVDRVKDWWDSLFHGKDPSSERLLKNLYNTISDSKLRFIYNPEEIDKSTYGTDSNFTEIIANICNAENLKLKGNSEQKESHRKLIKNQLSLSQPTDVAGITFKNGNGINVTSNYNGEGNNLIPLYAVQNKDSHDSACLIVCWYSVKDCMFGYLLQVIEHDWDFGWTENIYTLFGSSSIFYDFDNIDMSGEGEDITLSRYDIADMYKNGSTTSNYVWNNKYILSIILNGIRDSSSLTLSMESNNNRLICNNTWNSKDDGVTDYEYSYLYLLNQMYTLHTTPQSVCDYISNNKSLPDIKTEKAQFVNDMQNSIYSSNSTSAETNMNLVYLYNPQYTVSLSITWSDWGTGNDAFATLQSTLASYRGENFEVNLIDAGVNNETLQSRYKEHYDTFISNLSVLQENYLYCSLRKLHGVSHETPSRFATDMSEISKAVTDYDNISFGMNSDSSVGSESVADLLSFELLTLFNNMLANTVTINKIEEPSPDSGKELTQEQKNSYEYLLNDLTKAENYEGLDEASESIDVAKAQISKQEEDVEYVLKLAKAHEDMSSTNTSKDTPLEEPLKNQNGIVAIHISNGNFMDVARLLNQGDINIWSDVAGEVNKSAERAAEVLGPFCSNQVINPDKEDMTERFNMDPISRIFVPVLYTFANNKIGYELKACVSQVRLNVFKHLLKSEGSLLYVSDTHELFDYIMQLSTIYYGGGDLGYVIQDSCVIASDQDTNSFIIPYTYDSVDSANKEVFLLYFSPLYFNTDTTGKSSTSVWIGFGPESSSLANKDKSHGGLYYKTVYNLINNKMLTVKGSNGEVVDTTEILKQIELDRSAENGKEESMKVSSVNTTIADVFYYDTVTEYMSSHIRTPYDIFFSTNEEDRDSKRTLTLYDKALYSATYFTHVNNFEYAKTHNEVLANELKSDGILQFLYDYMACGNVNVYDKLADAESKYLTSIDPSEDTEVVGLSDVNEIEEKMMRAFNFDISVLESFEDSVNLFSTGSNTGEPLNVLRNCSRLAKYLILNVYLGNMEIAGVDKNALSNYYDVDLHSFLKTSYALNDMSTYFPSSIPKMNKFFGDGDNQGIGIYMLSDEYSTMEGDNEFNALSKLANLLYCVDYAVTVCSWSDLGTEECFYNWAVLDYFLCLAEGGESNKVSGYETSKEEKGLYFALTENGQKKLEAEADNTKFKDESNGYVKFADLSKAVELSEIKTDNLVDLALSNVTIEMFRSIIELHDMCEFLGIEPTEWSYNVQKYMEVYNNHIDIFTEIRKNPLLYKNSYKGETTIEEPLGEFFSTSKDEMSDEWRRGFALSSQFVPMETNLYDAATFDFLNDDTWVNEYYYKYGFHRKALFINTDSSAIVDEHVTGDGTNFVPAKLRDLLNYDRDIILKTDSSFYNADKLEQVWDKLDYSTIKSNGDAFYQSVHNTIESIGTTGQIQDIKNGVDGVINLDAASVLKTNGVTIYSPTLATNCSTYVTDKVEENIKNSIGDALNDKYYDAYILSQDELLSGIQQYDYTIKQPFSVVSAVYRNTALYNELSAFMASDTAVFKSSKSICKVDGTYYKDWLSLYNYMMISNLAEQIKNDAVSSLDLDAPIFIDIFGNIVTESGLVIIPAASNATLCGTSWTPLSVGFSELYYNGLFIQEDDITDDCRVWLTGTTSKKPVDKVEKVNGGGWFNLTSNGYLIRTTSVNSAGITAMIQWHTLQKNSQDIKQVFYNNAYYHTGENIYNAAVVNNVVEVLRGAPIEFIDYGKENISSQTDANVFGVYTALKLEELSNLIKKWSFTNPIFSMPSLADYPYTEYLILYSYKIAFVFFLGFFVFQIVIAGLKNKFGLSVIVDFVWSVGIIVLCVALLPALMNWSYYQSNKALLQDEMGYIMMLNYSKEFDGAEVGVTEISTPKSSTSLQLKLEDTTIDWWKLSYETLFRSTYNSITEQYTEQLRESALYGHEDVIQRSDGLFIDVNDLFDSTIISYVPSSRLFVNYTNSNDIIASYSSPYYVILDHLVAAINKYNFANNVDAYGYTVGANGHIVTYGLVEPYLVSDIFINDDYDALGLHKILGTTSQRATYIDAFTEDNYDTMTHSYWYPETYTAEERRNFTNLIQDYAQDWVLNNLDVIGKVPDEVFIKVMALQIAVEMNSQFGIDLANSVEIKGIDTLDIMRLMVGSRSDVYKYYSYSMPRFTYQVSGQFGVILAGIYLVLTWIIGYLKPLFLIALIALLIFNVIFRKMLFSQPSKSAMGFTFTCGALMCANFLYSGMIKISFNMVEWGMGSILSMLFGCLVQIIYLAILYVIARFIISDWRNIGAENVEQSLLSISMMGNTHSSVVTNHIKKMVPAFTGFNRKETDVTRRTPREHLDGMFKRDEERLERASMEE